MKGSLRLTKGCKLGWEALLSSLLFITQCFLSCKVLGTSPPSSSLLFPVFPGAYPTPQTLITATLLYFCEFVINLVCFWGKVYLLRLDWSFQDPPVSAFWVLWLRCMSPLLVLWVCFHSEKNGREEGKERRTKLFWFWGKYHMGECRKTWVICNLKMNINVFARAMMSHNRRALEVAFVMCSLSALPLWDYTIPKSSVLQPSVSLGPCPRVPWHLRQFFL